MTPATIRPTSRIAFCGLLAAATIACGRKTEPPNATPAPNATLAPNATAPAEHVAGSERFGWTQSASDRRELSTFHYAVYVDGTRVELTDVACEPPASPALTEFECSARLPPMSTGTHALELVMFMVEEGGGVRESPRSAPLMITKTGTETVGRDR